MAIKLEKRWPVRPPRESEELLSSWLCRVAIGNGLSPWSFFRTLSDKSNIVPKESCRRAWVDLLCRPEQAKHVAAGLGITEQELFAASAFPSVELAYAYGPDLLWNILAATPEHLMRNESDGKVSAEASSVHFCPLCMSEDSIPYFRREWRICLFRYCAKHQVRLSYRCPACGHSPRPHVRKDLGAVHLCHNCDRDLRTSHAAKATSAEVDRQFWVLEHLRRLIGHEPVTTVMDCAHDVIEAAATVVHGDADIMRLHAYRNLPAPNHKKFQKDALKAVKRILSSRFTDDRTEPPGDTI